MKRSRRALRHDVRDGIVRSIMAGELGPGDRLVEMHIAREYGTSQGPVREALRELEMLGFVTSEPHRGTYVRDPWHRGMLELYKVRGALEEAAARGATPGLQDRIEELQAEVDAMTQAADRDDAGSVVEHSERFHRLIVEASGNQLLHNLWSSLSIDDHTEITVITMSAPLREVAVSHQPIVDAIAAGDAERAARVSREHQVWFEELLDGLDHPAGGASADGAGADATSAHAAGNGAAPADAGDEHAPAADEAHAEPASR